MDPANTGDGSSVLTGMLNALSSFATPFANTLAYGKETASDIALTEERIRLGKLNGSGPTDPNAARRAAGSLYDFMFGNPGNASAGIAASQGALVPLMVIVALVALLIYIRRK